MRGRVYIAQPPLYRIKKGKSEKYIKDEKEFTREIMRRATENLTLENRGRTGGGPKVRLEGGELRAFLMNLDEYEQMFQKVERKLRDARVVEVLSNADLQVDAKADFQDQANMRAGFSTRCSKADLKPELKADEEHSALDGDVPRFHQRGAAHRHRTGGAAGIPAIPRAGQADRAVQHSRRSWW